LPYTTLFRSRVLHVGVDRVAVLPLAGEHPVRRDVDRVPAGVVEVRGGEGVGRLPGGGREPGGAGHSRVQPELPLAAEVEARGVAVQSGAGRLQGTGPGGERGVRLGLVVIGGGGHGRLLCGYGWSVHGHVRQPYTIPIVCSRLEWVETGWFIQSGSCRAGRQRAGRRRVGRDRVGRD